MKFNGAIFSKPQQDQLKEVIGEELEAVVEKVNDVDARMLNYVGDWVSGNEYHVNDVVTWATDGHLYEVIKGHTSSGSFDPDNPEYYKAMTPSKAIKFSFTAGKGLTPEAASAVQNAASKGKSAMLQLSTDGQSFRLPLTKKSRTLLAYCANVDSDNSITEYMFSWVEEGAIKIMKRTTTSTTGTPTTSYTELNVSSTSPQVSIYVGQ